jgi:histidine kinase/DNA gyrase B/HSP90-like ATPase
MSTYTVRSDDPAYTAWMAAVAAGQVPPAFDTRYLDHGLIERTFRDDFAANPEIGFDPEYFDRVFLEYRDWRMKWWRECVQNSVDAKASQIDLAVSQAPDGTWIVSCTDNGKGMTAETVTEKFLKMGGTGKGDRSGSSIGGFGKAKELLAFPWIAWEVWTRDVLVTGSGSHYEVTAAPEYLDGTRLQVTMPADKTTRISDAMEFLGRSRIPRVRFYLNGERFSAGGLRRGKLVEEWAFGELYHNKSAKRGVVYVRADGMYMFTAESFDSQYGTLLLELTGDTTKLLMPNREKFQNWEHERALRSFISELESEGERTLRKKDKLITEVWEGTGQISTAQGVSSVLDTVGPLPPVDARGLIISKESAEDLAGTLSNLVEVLQHTQGNLTLSPASARIVEEIVHEPLKGQANLEALAQQLVWTPSFMVENEVKRLHVPNKFKPDGMSGRMVALAQIWAEACRWVFIQLGRSAEYGVGFVFSDNALAVCKQRDGKFWLLLNPLRSVAPLAQLKIPAKGLLYKSSRDDMKALYARAVHEVTHMDSGYMRHDSSFAAALTDNFAKCSDGFKVMWKIAQGIKAPKIEKAPKRAKRHSLVEVTVRIAATSPDEGVTELLLHDSSGEAKAYGSELAGTALWADTVTLRSPDACNMVVNTYTGGDGREMLFGGVEIFAMMPTRLLADLHALQEVAGSYTADLAVTATRQVDGTIEVALDQSGKWETQIYAAELSLRALREPHGVDLGPVFISESLADFDVLQLAMPSLADLDRRYAAGKLPASQLIAWFRAQLARRDDELESADEMIEVIASAGPANSLVLRDPKWFGVNLASALTDTLIEENIVGLRDGLAIDKLVAAYLGSSGHNRVLQGLDHRFTMPKRLFADLLAIQELGIATKELRVLGSQVHDGLTELVLDRDDVDTAIYTDELGLRLMEEDESGALSDRVVNTPLVLSVESAAFGELSELLLTDKVDPIAIVPATQWLAWVEKHTPEVEAYEYGAHSRQPGYGSVPEGHIAIGHNELFPFGTVTYARRLTPEEQDHFSLTYIPTLDELEELAAEIARGMKYKQEWLELIEEGHPNEARMMIGRHLDAARMALPSDDYMLRQVATQVRRQLAAEGQENPAAVDAAAIQALGAEVAEKLITRHTQDEDEDPEIWDSLQMDIYWHVENILLNMDYEPPVSLVVYDVNLMNDVVAVVSEKLP